MKFDRINEFIQAQKSTHSGYWWVRNATKESIEAARVTMFTLGDYPEQDSAENLIELFETAERFDHRYLVVKDTFVQFIGGYKIPDHKFFTQTLRDHIKQTLVLRYDTANFNLELQLSDNNSICNTFRPSYYMNVCMPTHQGVYDVTSRKKITNRQEIIKTFWKFGFIARRGRPLSVAKDTLGATASEIEKLIDDYNLVTKSIGLDKKMTEYRRRTITTFNTISGYCAWPGTW